eukprot:SAG31_NODE_34704_length_330_cov_0.878788_1_plen_71_part_01
MFLKYPVPYMFQNWPSCRGGGGGRGGGAQLVRTGGCVCAAHRSKAQRTACDPVLLMAEVIGRYRGSGENRI